MREFIALCSSEPRKSPVTQVDTSLQRGQWWHLWQQACFQDLREVGETCGKNRVAKIMKANKIRAIHGYKIPRARYSRPALIAPNRLEQQFNVNKADTTWVTDITYIRTWQGWLYLAIVLDLYSRKVLGWSMCKPPHISASLN